MIDLHVHSTASDGQHPPVEVVRRAARAGVTILALTDHDTLAGVAEAAAAGAACGVRVIAGCEFSVGVLWGEMHLLAYFLPSDRTSLDDFLAEQRAQRAERARAIVGRLNHLGVPVSEADVFEAANGGAVGRPHVARALVAQGAVADIGEAFDRYIGWGRPAFVAKRLPPLETVTALVRRAGGITAAAHLKDRATRAALGALEDAGVDGVEVLHPAHDDATRRRIGRLAADLGLLPTGGSDWHGDTAGDPARAPLGSLAVPAEWVVAMEDLHRSRSGVT